MLDFNLWDALLKEYVNSAGRVNYLAWKTESASVLREWLIQMENVDVSAYSHAPERLAYWINLYNAWVISSVLENYPIPSILPRVLGLPNWLKFWWFFSRRFPPHHRYSLNKIEHQILRKDFAEHRIHFALVCAAVGCPLLRNQAYFPDTVLEQLEADAIRFINNPNKVRYDSATHTLYCSKILKWYGKDFLKVAPSIPDYIRPYLQTEMSWKTQPRLAYLEYDWSLNQQ